MRKLSVRFAILCIVVLLVGVTALAVSGTVSKLENQDANVTVKLNDGNPGEAPSFTITRTNAVKGKLYTVLIRSGAENDKPTGDKNGQDGNLVYMDIVEATDSTLKINKAYPKEMSDGTYRVFMSDYGTSKIQQVATFQVGETNHDDTAKLGDVNGDKNIDMDDALAIMRHIAKVPGWDLSEKLSVADVSKNQKIDMDDALAILRHIAKVPGWDLS